MVSALFLVRRTYRLTEHAHTMEGLLTHVASSDCFITRPHPATECGIVTTWWRCQEGADIAMRRQHEDEQRERKDQERA
jgi:hypothetical protein